MAELTPLYMDINSVYSGDELGLPYRDFISEGIVGVNDLKVQAKGTPDLSVDILAGAAWIMGDTNVDAQPTYRVRNDATVNRGITPDPSNPRKVLVVAQITDETFAGTGRKFEILALHGTPAGSPAEPALPASAIPLALIDVTAADTDITNAQITNRRVRAVLGVPAAVAVPGSGDLAYQEFTSSVAITGTSSATATTIVTAPAFTADGSTIVVIEFCATYISKGNAEIQIGLFEDGTAIGRMAYTQGTFIPIGRPARRRTPASGSRTYSIRGWVDGGSGSVAGGAGGTGNTDQPGFIRIFRA